MSLPQRDVVTRWQFARYDNGGEGGCRGLTSCSYGDGDSQYGNASGSGRSGKSGGDGDGHVWDNTLVTAAELCVHGPGIAGAAIAATLRPQLTKE